ncbi:MAG TPA: hypothetical protein VEG08_15340 [Terriglobales bacterium]|nr:hypothetical protein [Terriglobales bacterium]
MPSGGVTRSFAGITTTNQYNKRLQPSLLSAATTGSGSQTVLSLTYDFHLGGNDNGNVYAILNNRDAARSAGYSYDALNRVAAAVDQANGVNYATAASYAPPGELAGVTYGASGTFAGIVTANSFNNRLQPASIHASSSAGTVLDLSYSFNSGTAQAPVDNGTLVRIANNRDLNRSQNFTYDALNRITAAWTDGTNWGDTYTVDAWGNLTNKTQMQSKTGGGNRGNRGQTGRFLVVWTHG